MKLLINILYYYFLIGGAISLIIYNYFTIYNDHSYTTAVCLLINLIMLTFAYYRLFMRNKDDKLTWFEKMYWLYYSILSL